MLPFLKNKEGAMSGPIEHVSMTDAEDEGGEYTNLHAIAEDMMAAFEKKNLKMLISALEFLCEHIATMDEEQDKQGME